MPTVKQTAKSKTMWVSAAFAMAGIVIQNMEVLLPYFGAYGGLASIAVAAIYAGLRVVTKEPLSSK